MIFNPSWEVALYTHQFVIWARLLTRDLEYDFQSLVRSPSLYTPVCNMGSTSHWHWNCLFDTLTLTPSFFVWNWHWNGIICLFDTDTNTDVICLFHTDNDDVCLFYTVINIVCLFVWHWHWHCLFGLNWHWRCLFVLHWHCHCLFVRNWHWH